MAKERLKDRLPVIKELNSSLTQRILRQELTREIERCLAYFQEQPSIGGQGEVTTVKSSSRIRVGKEGGALFFEETVSRGEGIVTPYREVITIKDGKVSKKRFSLTNFDDEGNPRPIRFEQGLIRRQEREGIIDKIHNSIYPYAQYLRETNEKSKKSKFRRRGIIAFLGKGQQKK